LTISDNGVSQYV